MRIESRWLLFGTVFSSSLLLMSGARANAEAQVPELLDEVLNLSGCYELEWSEWNPSGWSAVADDLPHRIWLTPTVLESRTHGSPPQHAFHFVLRPAPGAEQSSYPDERWTVGAGAKTVSLSWAAPFQGIGATLAVRGSPGEFRLVGLATAWTDELTIVDSTSEPRDAPSSRLLATQIGCG